VTEPELRALREEDWALLRDVRLRALLDSPDAFGRTHAESVDLPEGHWRERAGGPSPTLVVVDQSRVVAMGGVFVGDGTASVWGMWTDPAARGRGHGARVLDALLAWADGRGLPVDLEVTEGNADAVALYASRGFVETGARTPLRPGSSTHALGMVRPI